MTKKKIAQIRTIQKNSKDSDSAPLGNAYIRAVNRARIIDWFRNGRLLSRADLARHCDLSKPTVSAIVDDLISEGILQEVGKRSSEGGRRAMLLELNPESATFVGIHFGEAVTQVAVTDAFGRILIKQFADTVSGNPDESMQTAHRLIQSALAEIEIAPERVNAVGVSVPGLVERQDGSCKFAPNLGWRNYPVARKLSDLLGVEVYVANTTQTAALAEHQMGVAKDVPNFVWLYVGKGVGACAVIGGRIHFGTRGFAGEIGHIRVNGAEYLCGCGKRGCLETTCSNLAIAREAKRALSGDASTTLATIADEELTAFTVSRYAERGDRVAQQIMTDAGRALGIGASMLINIYDPQMVVIGGPVAGSDEAFLAGVRERAAELSIESGASIVFSQLGRDIYLQGAVSMAMDQSNAAYRIVKSAKTLDVQEADGIRMRSGVM